MMTLEPLEIFQPPPLCPGLEIFQPPPLLIHALRASKHQIIREFPNAATDLQRGHDLRNAKQAIQFGALCYSILYALSLSLSLPRKERDQPPLMSELPTAPFKKRIALKIDRKLSPLNPHQALAAAAVKYETTHSFKSPLQLTSSNSSSSASNQSLSLNGLSLNPLTPPTCSNPTTWNAAAAITAGSSSSSSQAAAETTTKNDGRRERERAIDDDDDDDVLYDKNTR
jgi:hypothetical protein